MMSDPNCSDDKTKLIEACHLLLDAGLLFGTYGNLSVRFKNGFWITPSRVPYESMTPDDLVGMSSDGTRIHSDNLPSSETEIHRQIYSQNPDIAAVIHSHALSSMSASTLHQEIPTILEEQAQVIGGPIPCARYVRAGRHADLAQSVLAALNGTQGVLLANHGAIALGRDLDEAIAVALVIERVCEAYLATAGSGLHPVHVPESAVEYERGRWLYQYGRESDRPMRVTESGTT